MDDVALVHIQWLKEALIQRWQELRAGELVVEAAMAEFDGEGLLHSDVRAMLTEAEATLWQLHEEVQRYGGEFRLEEPTDEQVEAVHNLVERGL